MARYTRVRRPSVTKPSKVTKYTPGGTKSIPDIRGIKEVQDLLFMLLERVPERYSELIESVGATMEQDVKTNIRGLDKPTGLLESSVQTRRLYTKKTNRVIIEAGGKIAPHAHLVEFGHRMFTKDGRLLNKIVKGKAFMRNAFNKNIPFLISETERILDEIIT